MKTYSSSDLKVKTAHVLKDVVQSKYGAVLIEKRNQPRVVIMEYDKWLDLMKSASKKNDRKSKRLEIVSEYSKLAKKEGLRKDKIDSAKLIRGMRDNDYD